LPVQFIAWAAAHSEEATRIGLGSLFAELLVRFDAMTGKQVETSYFPARLCVYATHDTTIIILLIALGVFKKHWPPYVANISFELYRGDQPGTFDVKVLYNGHPVVLPCASGNVLCPLEDFRRFVSHFLPASDGTQ
jgi:hypothetical protein